MSVQIVEEITSCESNSVITLLTLHADVSEDEIHLLLIVLGKILPEFNDHRFEISVNIVSIIGSAKGTLADTTGHISTEA